MKLKRKSAKSSESSASKSRLARLRKRLPKVKRGTPTPLLWAATGSLVGIGVSLGSAAMSGTVRHDLQFAGLIMSSLLRLFPVAMAGALGGAFVALGWFGCRR